MGYAVVDEKPRVPRQAGPALEPAQPRLQEGLGLLQQPGLPAQRGPRCRAPT
jgi:hypothetical protein